MAIHEADHEIAAVLRGHAPEVLRIEREADGRYGAFWQAITSW